MPHIITSTPRTRRRSPSYAPRSSLGPPSPPRRRPNGVRQSPASPTSVLDFGRVFGGSPARNRNVRRNLFPTGQAVRTNISQPNPTPNFATIIFNRPNSNISPENVDPITLQPLIDIPRHQRIFANGQFYDATGLHQWLERHRTIPHSRKAVRQVHFLEIGRRKGSSS